MSGAKSLADQQKEFKKALLSSSAVTQSIAEARATNAPSKTYAYGKAMLVFGNSSALILLPVL